MMPQQWWWWRCECACVSVFVVCVCTCICVSMFLCECITEGIEWAEVTHVDINVFQKSQHQSISFAYRQSLSLSWHFIESFSECVQLSLCFMGTHYLYTVRNRKWPQQSHWYQEPGWDCRSEVMTCDVRRTSYHRLHCIHNTSQKKRKMQSPRNLKNTSQNVKAVENSGKAPHPAPYDTRHERE